MDPNSLPAIDLDSEKLRSIVDAFLERSKMKPTVFGLEVAREGGLVKSLREGRAVSVDKSKAILSFIAEWDRNNGTAPTPSATKTVENICPPAGEVAEADSPSPFSDPSAAPQGSSPTCSTIPEPQLPLADSRSCSSSQSKAA